MDQVTITTQALIGITGRQGAGKNTLADAIVGHAGGIIQPFADGLRDVTEAAFGSRYETQEEKAAVDGWWQSRIGPDTFGQLDGCLGDQPVTGRRILQYVGTELFRQHVHPDFWLFVMERRLEMNRHAHIVVVPDVRFDNEAKFIRDRGGIIIEIRRLNTVAEPSTHVSERGVGASLVNKVLLTHSLEETRNSGAELAQRYARTAMGCTEEGG